MKKLIILEHEPLTVRLKKIWNINSLIQRGVDVEYWDFSTFIFPNISIPNKVEDKCVKIISDLSYFEYLLSAIDVKKTVLVVELFPSWKNRRIYFLINKYNIFHVKIDLYANTYLYVPLRHKLWSFVKKASLFSLFEKIGWFTYKKFYSITIYNQLYSSSKLVSPDVRINHPDFETFIDTNDVRLCIEPYILFIDTYYPLHPDLKFYLKYDDIDTNTKEYRDTMCAFFDYLEQKYNKVVIIAAHPKSDYVGDEFGDRKIIKDQTCNLIKNADLIITHESNSLSFITLANKPFVIVYPDSYNRYYNLFDYITRLARYCGKQAYNLNKENWKDICFSSLEKHFRETYIYSFLTSFDTQHKKNIDIWIDNLLRE